MVHNTDDSFGISSNEGETGIDRGRDCQYWLFPHGQYRDFESPAGMTHFDFGLVVGQGIGHKLT